MRKTRCGPGLLGLFVLLAWLAWLDAAGAQTARLRQRGSTSGQLTVSVGDRIDIEVFADLQGVASAGVSLFISVPANAFQIVDQVPGELGSQVGVQPFVQGPLFSGATPGPNLLLPESDPAASSFPGQQLEYSMVLGAGSNRTRTGSGVVATFTLLCIKPIENGDITIDDSPVRETRLVLSDGVSERRFRTVQGLSITITGIQLRDIPDVVLLPAQADSVQIGSLKNYVVATLAPLDSIRWTYAPTNLDSLSVEIHPVTKVVKITPLYGWKGRRQLVFTATEPTARINGLPPLSASEVSTVIVNTPPRFTRGAGADGIKRDTITIREDDYTFAAGTEPVAVRAYRWDDLDPEVFDPDIINPQTELHFAVLTYGNADTDPVRGSIDPGTHEVLVWSRVDYSGRDSVKVVVRDGFRSGEDSLRIVVNVTNVDDAPRFTLLDREPKMRTGGSVSYLLPEIATDPDTPVGQLLFSWIDDPGRHFTVDTTRTPTGLRITVTGVAGYQGTGRVSFRVADPAAPASLVDQMVLFLTASMSAPPDVYPAEIKVDLTPGGPAAVEALDAYVTDPDNAVADLAWLLPSAPRRTVIAVDERRNMSLSAPGAPTPFVGYEAAQLTVTDPTNLSDVLNLRIYSSDGRPVIGGIPDLIMDRGETYNGLDLDGYYYDADNRDDEMLWEALGSYSGANLQVQIDPLTHVVTFYATPTAAFKTETVIFRVTSPEGASAADTMLVTIRSGGDPGTSGFRLLPLPADLQVPVNRFTQLLDLDNYVQPADTAIGWTVSVLAGQHSMPRVLQGNVLSVFGLQVGTDTLQFTARDSLGHVQSVSARLRVYGEAEALRLRSIPDIQFIAGQTFTTGSLNEYVEDRVAHPDSVVVWSLEMLGAAGNLFIRINPDRSLFAVAPDTVTARVVLVARDTVLNISGRDTIRVIALDPALGNRALKAFPPVVFVSGQEDSSTVLNPYLPDDFLVAGAAPSVLWSVTGQRICQPVISTVPPHRLRLRGVGSQVGRDTLYLVADIGGGFRATGPLEVTVLEPVDNTTLGLFVVPNVVNPLYLEVFVTSRRAMSGMPTVTRSFATVDSTVGLRQIESDLAGRGVLAWTGSLRLNPAANGTVRFKAQGVTALGTDVSDTTSVVYATAALGKPLAMASPEAQLWLPAGALAPGTGVLMQSVRPPTDQLGPLLGQELELICQWQVFPLAVPLGQPATLATRVGTGAGQGVYRAVGDRWAYLGPAGQAVRTEALGRFAVLRDRVPPQLAVAWSIDGDRPRLSVRAADEGSGIDSASVRGARAGEPVLLAAADGGWSGLLPGGSDQGSEVVVAACDRAGNCAQELLTLAAPFSAQPRVSTLAANYPNPFNPATTIVFFLAPPGPPELAATVRLSIYDLGGQRVRTLWCGTLADGWHEIRWDGRDETGTGVSSGVYVCRLETPDGALARRLTLLK
jgi:hypothetical protein